VTLVLISRMLIFILQGGNLQFIQRKPQSSNSVA
jgi:hypothetical protein